MNYIRLHANDNVDVAIGFASGAGRVPNGHKISNQSITKGQRVIKFGQIIGVATQDIESGAHLHTHNCGYIQEKERLSGIQANLEVLKPARTTFLGYRRNDGKVGTRNYVAVISTVNCSATVVAEAARIANQDLLPRFKGIDGFIPITHKLGCGMTGAGTEPFAILQRTLAGYCSHPNIAGSLLVGVGCEVNHLSNYNTNTTASVMKLSMQDVGGTRAAIARALECLEMLALKADREIRETCPVSELVLGLQCGGSDGMSRLSCNPALGVASDLLIAAGGISILSETPEIFGAEHLLKQRSDPIQAAKIDELILSWQRYAELNHASLDNNPSPGNLAGGITTILEKSLGAVAKGGQSPVVEVLKYAEKPEQKGLVFMDTPGYDPVSVTGQIAGGATIIAFTTGRGSCFGSKPSPTIKLTSTSELFEKMPDDMDINCGTILSGDVTIEQKGQEVYNAILDVASGERTKSEDNGVGDLEFTPWQLGAVL